MNQADRNYLLLDEMPRVHDCLMAAVDNAEGREISYYGILSPHFYYIIRDGMIASAVDRTWDTNLRVYLRKWFARFKVLEPRDEYRCL